jgi:alkylation response protein AidB-like acyl-CoA dehydrogenase
MSEATMDVAADEAQELARMLRDSARDFAQARLGRAQRATPADADTAVSAAWREMTALGWLGLLVATAHGGSGLGMAEMAVVLEELGRVASCEPLAATGVLAVQAIAGSDQAALRARLLEGLVQGEELPALAWQEHARLQADDATSSLRAESSAQGWRLSGGKRFVQPGTGWSGLVLPVQRDDGLALLWLPRATPGLTVQPARLADGSGCADLRCDGVLLAEPQWLASPAVAAQALQQALAWGRLAAAAELLGVVRGALAMLTEQLRTSRACATARPTCSCSRNWSRRPCRSCARWSMAAPCRTWRRRPRASRRVPRRPRCWRPRKPCRCTAPWATPTSAMSACTSSAHWCYRPGWATQPSCARAMRPSP